MQVGHQASWPPSKPATQVSQPLFPTNTPVQQQRIMSQQQNVRKTYTEGHIYIAISDIKSEQIQSERHAAEVYSISQTMIQDRRAGRRAQRKCEPNSKRLTKLEEKVV
jgi:hypothetical protein